MAATATAPDPIVELTNRIDKLATALNNPARGSAAGQQMLDQQQPPGYTRSRNSEQKPFSFHRFLAGYKAKNDTTLCPHEHDVLVKYTKALKDTRCNLDGVSGGLWFPLDINQTYDGQLTSTDEAAKNYAYVKAVMNETRPAYDPDEEEWLRRRMWIRADTSTGQSAFQGQLGESLVAPPVQGAVIPLIRPNTAFLAAGAQTVTLPPNGKMVFPRIIGAPSVKAIGEGQEMEVSMLTSGFMELNSKPMGGMVKMTEEASAYTSGTMDVIAQSELGRSMGLMMDAYAFYGKGDSLIPAGLTSNTYAGNGTTTGVINVETYNPSARGITADGNTLLPEYGDIFPALIEERSFGVEEGVTGAWVMRPSVYASAVAARASAVTPGDDQGPMVDILRRFEMKGPNVFKGRKVVRTTNLVNNNTKGASGATLSDAFFGVWQYGIMATYAAINFQQGHNGVTFANRQYLIRGVTYGDIGYQYPEAFLWYPNVQGLKAGW